MYIHLICMCVCISHLHTLKDPINLPWCPRSEWPRGQQWPPHSSSGAARCCRNSCGFAASRDPSDEPMVPQDASDRMVFGRVFLGWKNSTLNMDESYLSLFLEKIQLKCGWSSEIVKICGVGLKSRKRNEYKTRQNRDIWANVQTPI